MRTALSKTGWFALLWLLSVTALALMTALIRWGVMLAFSQ